MSDTPAIAGFRVVSQDAWEAGLAACEEYRAMVDKLERENAALRNEIVRLNNQTMWVCSCGGTDCAGQKENAALRKQMEQWEQSTQWFAEWADKKQELERENTALRKEKDRLDWLITKAPFCVLSTLSSDPAAARLKIDREMEFPTV